MNFISFLQYHSHRRWTKCAAHNTGADAWQLRRCKYEKMVFRYRRTKYVCTLQYILKKEEGGWNNSIFFFSLFCWNANDGMQSLFIANNHQLTINLLTNENTIKRQRRTVSHSYFRYLFGWLDARHCSKANKWIPVLQQILFYFNGETFVRPKLFSNNWKDDFSGKKKKNWIKNIRNEMETELRV